MRWQRQHWRGRCPNRRSIVPADILLCHGKTRATAAMQKLAVSKKTRLKNNSGKQTRLVRSKSKNGDTRRECARRTTTPSAYGEPDVFKVLTHECRRPLITHRHQRPPSAREALGLPKCAREASDQGDSSAARPRFLVREEAECTPARMSTQLTASPRDDSLWMSFSIGRPRSFEPDAGRL